MVQLAFDSVPSAPLRHNERFTVAVLATDSVGEPDTEYAETVTLWIAEGDGRLIGDCDTRVSHGEALFSDIRFEGAGPFRLGAVSTSAASDPTEWIEVLPPQRTADERCAASVVGGEEELDRWLSALDSILSQEGCTTVQASEVTDWLLIGGKPAAEQAMQRNPQRLTHLLNCCEPWCAGDGPATEQIKYVGFEAYDEAGYRLLDEHYHRTIRPTLDATRADGGRCLVHCAMGVNRSGLACAAYLIEAVWDGSCRCRQVTQAEAWVCAWQCVVSGSTHRICCAARQIREAGMSATPLLAGNPFVVW